MSISNIVTEDELLTLEISDVDLSFINAIRRIILSEIPCIAFRTEPYDDSTVNIIKNTSSLHNEFISHRIGMIPIHIKDIDNFEESNYKFILNVKNEKNVKIDVTTKDINVYELDNTGKFSPVSSSKRDALFPPDPISNDYILITHLKPDNTGKNQGEQLHFEATAVKSIGKENSRWTTVCQSTFKYKIDESKAKDAFTNLIKIEQNKKREKLTENEIQKLQKRFRISQADRYYHTNENLKPNKFIMNVESVGVLDPQDIFQQSIEILIQKLNNFIQNIKNENIKVQKSNTIQNAVDLIIPNEDHTLGNIIQSHMCSLYKIDNNNVNFVGYNQPHPLENYIVIRVGLGENTNINKVKEFVIDCTNKIITISTSFFNEFKKKRI